MPETTPRRNQLQKMTPVELAIRECVEQVETLGADVRLTDAVVLLSAANDSVADFIDGVETRRFVRVGESLVDAAAAAGREVTEAEDAIVTFGDFLESWQEKHGCIVIDTDDPDGMGEAVAHLLDLSNGIKKRTAALASERGREVDADRADAERWRGLRDMLTIELDSMSADGYGPYRHFLRFKKPDGKFIPGSANIRVPAITHALLDTAADAIGCVDENAYSSALARDGGAADAE